MEIDFNPSRIPKAELSQPVARQGASPTAADAASFSTTSSLAAKLNDISLARPEKVEQAKTLASSDSYPPVELLIRIAALLAVKLKN